MAYIGITTRKTTCAICRKDMAIGSRVYCDHTKNQGSHVVHIKCWDDLRTARGRQQFTGRRPKLSTEPLDPAF